MSIGGENVLAEDGTFRFRGLYPGRWTVSASTNLGGTWKRAEVETEAGATGVVLTVD